MIRFCSRLFAVCLLMAVCAAPALGADAKATIVFTGNGFGVFKACPTCGKGALGGLDRRAGYFERVRSESPDALFVSAGYEFGSYMSKRKIRAELMAPLAEAYTILAYDAALALPMEDATMRAEGEVLPEPFCVAGGQPWARVLERSGLKIGVVGFPAKTDAYGEADTALKRAVAAAAAGLRPDVDLVLGLSPWGERAELAFAREFPGAVDFLLGSGPGTGYGIRSLGEGGTVWVRPPFEGRGAIRIGILSLPEADAGRRWEEGKDFESQVVQFNAEVRGDPRIANLFAWY